MITELKKIPNEHKLLFCTNFVFDAINGQDVCIMKNHITGQLYIRVDRQGVFTLYKIH